MSNTNDSPSVNKAIPDRQALDMQNRKQRDMDNPPYGDLCDHHGTDHVCVNNSAHIPIKSEEDLIRYFGQDRLTQELPAPIVEFAPMSGNVSLQKGEIADHVVLQISRSVGPKSEGFKDYVVRMDKVRVIGDKINPHSDKFFLPSQIKGMRVGDALDVIASSVNAGTTSPLGNEFAGIRIHPGNVDLDKVETLVSPDGSKAVSIIHPHKVNEEPNREGLRAFTAANLDLKNSDKPSYVEQAEAMRKQFAAMEIKTGLDQVDAQALVGKIKEAVKEAKPFTTTTFAKNRDPLDYYGKGGNRQYDAEFNSRDINTPIKLSKEALHGRTGTGKEKPD